MPSLVQRVRQHVASALTPATMLLGAIGGSVFAIVALWVYASIRQQSVLLQFDLSQTSGILVALYVVSGLVILGGSALVLLIRGKLVTPFVALIGCFSWASYSTWQSLETAREIGAAPGVSLRPDSVFFLFWFLPLGLILLLALVEYAVRSGLSGTSRGNTLG